MAKLDEIITGFQEKALNNIATINSNEEAKARGYFPYHKFKLHDYPIIIKENYRIRRMFKSLFQTTGVIKKHDTKADYKTKITQDEFNKLDDYIRNTLNMDSWGVANFTEKEIYKGVGIPYENVIVMTMGMDRDGFLAKDFPNVDCFIGIYDTYADTGIGAIAVTEYLRNLNFGSVPNHSVGGNIDYTKAGYKANLGFIGRHGMLITPETGPCNRISVVYTSIENLDEFLPNNDDHTWGNNFCNKCRKCFKTCPNDAVYKEPIINEFGHVECISNAKCNTEFTYYACGLCISTCPFTIVGYNSIHSKFVK